MNPDEHRAGLPPTTVIAVLGITAAALHLAGPAPLSPAPVWSVGAWIDWIGRTAPVEVAFGVVRLAAVAACYHLLAMQLVASTARLVGSASIVRLAEQLTPPPLRTSARRLAGVGLTAVTALAAPTSAAGAGDPTGRAVIEVVPDGAGTASITVLPTSHDAAPLDDRTTVPSATAGVSVEGTVDAPGTEPRQHRVRPGDHLWSIAAAEIGAGSTEAPDEAIVERYWRRLVLANPQLDDPDLVFAGDVITLPPVGHTG